MGRLERVQTLLRHAVDQPAAIEGAALPYFPGMPLATPFAPHMAVQSFAIAHLFDSPPGVYGREAALQLPSVSKGRHEIQKLAALGLFTVESERGATIPPATLEPTPKQPRWLTTSSYGSPWLRMQATLDDLIFDGAALWWVDRGARNVILDAAHVAPGEWSIDPDGRVTVRGTVAQQGQVIAFTGPLPGGLLVTARNTISAGLALEDVWAGRVESPAPLVELHQTTDDVIEDDEKNKILNAWNMARRSRTGATAWTPSWLETKVHGTSATDLMIAARNQLAVDIAAHLGLPPTATNSSLATSTLTYVNGAVLDYQLRTAWIPWAASVTARLSQDDVTPGTQAVAFNLDALPVPMSNGNPTAPFNTGTPNDTGPTQGA